MRPAPNPVGYVDNPYSGCDPHDLMPKYTKKEKAQQARGESPGICPDRTVPATPIASGGQEAAECVELTLPETGVCGGAGLFGEPEAVQGDGGGCCVAPTTLKIGIGVLAASAGGC